MQRGRWQILALFALFVVPTVVAWGLLVGGWRPAGQTNHGELIQPPPKVAPTGWLTRAGEPLRADRFQGQWTLLVATPADCGDPCASLLDTLRRVRIALGKDADRLSLLLLQPAATRAPDIAFPALTTAVAPAPAVRELAERARVQLVDYQGLRMMAYSMPLNASGLLEDLEQLLRLSDEAIEDRIGASQ